MKASRTTGAKPASTLAITGYIHCKACIEDLKQRSRETGRPVSPKEYAQLEVGFTAVGWQVWCRRHELNVVHIDFQGATHPAELRAIDPEAVGVCCPHPRSAHERLRPVRHTSSAAGPDPFPCGQCKCPTFVEKG